MKIVIAPDSFKDSLSAAEASAAIEQGFRMILPNASYLKIPMADGGEGTTDALITASSGRKMFTPVTDPLGNKIQAAWGILGDEQTAIIEMAAASGINLVPQHLRNPMHTTSFGTGELILAALNAGIQKIILGIGGSATNDGGIGMLAALGARLKFSKNANQYPTAADLLNLIDIDLTNLHPKIQKTNILVACDVDNPLCGENGASNVFGPQKGATKEMISSLDAALARFADIIKRLTNRSVLEVAGSGAAGGIGAACIGLLNAKLQPGVKIVSDAVDLADKIQDADLVITGEGRIDGQTINGKTPIGVAQIAKQFNKPVIALAGCLGANHELVYSHGIDAVFPIITQTCDLNDALQQTKPNIILTARNIAAIFAKCI